MCLGCVQIRRRSRLCTSLLNFLSVRIKVAEPVKKAPYITLLSAMLLLTSPPSSAFISLTNLLSRPCLHAFYANNQPDIDAYYRVFENLQADSFPKIYANCKNLGIRLPESWFRGMLVEQIPFEVACRLWDQVGRPFLCNQG